MLKMSGHLARGFDLRRFMVMLFAQVLMSIGVALFKFSATGNDPCNALLLTVSSRFQVDFALCGLTSNILFFLIELLWGRRYIGIGTFANWVCIAPMVSLILRMASPIMPQTPSLWQSGLLLASGVLILSLSLSLYQSADMGIAPYDSLAMVLRDHTPLPYFTSRVIVDTCFAAAAFCLGGVVGVGTAICMLGLGPFVTFFDKLRSVSEPGGR